MTVLPFKERVKIIEKVSSKHPIWQTDCLLVEVERGLGKLAFYTERDKSGENYMLLLNNTSLMNVHGSFCPTCAKLIEIGYGLENIDDNAVNSIKLAEEIHDDIEQAGVLLSPILTLLESGLYLISKIKMNPTDGEGNFFWSESLTKRDFIATSDIVYESHHGTGWPNFLYPTQPLHRLNIDQVNFYRSQITMGKKMTGLAFYISGFISALLDGHHRATAACLEGTSVQCLTIMKVRSYKGDEPEYKQFWAGGHCFPLDIFNQRPLINNLLDKYNPNPWAPENKRRKLITKAKHKKFSLDKELQKELRAQSKKYPDYLTAAFRSMVDEVSIDKLYELWDKYDYESTFEFDIILRALFIDHSKELYELAKKIVRDKNKRDHWEQAYKYLATFGNEEVEDIFIKYLIDNEFDQHDSLRKFVDEYLKGDFEN